MPSPLRMLIVTAMIFSLSSSLLAKETASAGQGIPESRTQIMVPSISKEVLPNSGKSWKGFFADERDDELDVVFGFKSKIETVPYDLSKRLHSMIFAGWKNKDAKLLLLAAQMLVTLEAIGQPDELFPSESVLQRASELAVENKDKALVEAMAKVWQGGFGLNNKKEAAKYRKIARSLAPGKKTRGTTYHYVIMTVYPGQYYAVVHASDSWHLSSSRRCGHPVSRPYPTRYAAERAGQEKVRQMESNYAGHSTTSRTSTSRQSTYGSRSNYGNSSSSRSTSKWFKKAPKYTPQSKSTSSLDDFLKSDPFGSAYKKDKTVNKMPKYKSPSKKSNWFQTVDDLMSSSSKPYLLLKKPSKYTGDKLTIVVNGSDAHKYHMRSGYKVISGHSTKLEASYAMRHHSRYGNR